MGSIPDPSETCFLDWDVGLTINDCQLARGSKKFPRLADAHSTHDRFGGFRSIEG